MQPMRNLGNRRGTLCKIRPRIPLIAAPFVRMIHLAVIIDRGGRELPIAANYVGKTVRLPAGKNIQVRLNEIDKRDEVVIE